MAWLEHLIRYLPFIRVFFNKLPPAHSLWSFIIIYIYYRISVKLIRWPPMGNGCSNVYSNDDDKKINFVGNFATLPVRSPVIKRRWLLVQYVTKKNNTPIGQTAEARKLTIYRIKTIYRPIRLK